MSFLPQKSTLYTSLSMLCLFALLTLFNGAIAQGIQFTTLSNEAKARKGAEGDQKSKQTAALVMFNQNINTQKTIAAQQEAAEQARRNRPPSPPPAPAAVPAVVAIGPVAGGAQ